MKDTLSSHMGGRDNNFNIIRFIAAFLVLFSHSFALSMGSGNAEPLRNSLGITLGNIAVDIFFVTSGFLITSSYFSRKSLAAFAWSRFLRIYPALIVSILFCVFVVGLYFTTLGAQEFLTTKLTYAYLVKNTVLFSGVEFTLPGVFEDTPYKRGVNGSLWTLPYEVNLYAALAIALTINARLRNMLGRISHIQLLIIIGALLLSLNVFNHFDKTLPHNLIHLSSMFFMGSAFYALKDKIILSPTLATIFLSTLLFSTFNNTCFTVIYLLTTPYLILYAAYVPGGVIRKFNHFGDYSYGMYIYAFPIQQSLAKLVPGISPYEMIVNSFIVTVALAALSWHIIEKRFLRYKDMKIIIEQFRRVFR